MCCRHRRSKRQVCEQIVTDEHAWCCVIYVSNQYVVVRCALSSLTYPVTAAVGGEVDSSAAGNISVGMHGTIPILKKSRSSNRVRRSLFENAGALNYTEAIHALLQCLAIAGQGAW